MVHKDISEDKRMKSKPMPIQTYDSQPAFNYRQLLGIIIVAGFLIIGTAAGSYYLLEDLMVAPCLGCLGLYPNIELEFRFETVDDQEHPEFVLERLNEGPVFIEFTQNDENCAPCARIRPKIKELEDEYSEEITFFIINIDVNEKTMVFKNDEQVEPISDSEEKEYYQIYDVEKIAGGLVATPTYIIVTINEDDDGNIRPSFAVGYGIYKDNKEDKTKEDLAKALEYAVGQYYYYKKWYEPEELIN